MDVNPYEPPHQADRSTLPPVELRSLALSRFRIAMLFLLLPAILNVYYFAEMLSFEFVILGFIELAMLSVIVWFLGFPLVEFIARLLHRLFSNGRPFQAWMLQLYLRIQKLRGLALAGSLLWIVWVVGFYLIGIPFMMISVPVGILAHVLGACFYVPLFLAWYRAEKSAATE